MPSFWAKDPPNICCVSLILITTILFYIGYAVSTSSYDSHLLPIMTNEITLLTKFFFVFLPFASLILGIWVLWRSFISEPSSIFGVFVFAITLVGLYIIAIYEILRQHHELFIPKDSPCYEFSKRNTDTTTQDRETIDPLLQDMCKDLNFALSFWIPSVFILTFLTFTLSLTHWRRQRKIGSNEYFPLSLDDDY